MLLRALVTSTGNANSTWLHLVQFHALPVPVARAINLHIALSTVLLTIHIAASKGECFISYTYCIFWHDLCNLCHHFLPRVRVFLAKCTIPKLMVRHSDKSLCAGTLYNLAFDVR